MVFNMLKPFLTPEVRDGVVFHSGNLATLRSVSFFVKLSQKCVEIVPTQGMKQFDKSCKFLQSRFLLKGLHIRPMPTFLRA